MNPKDVVLNEKIAERFPKPLITGMIKLDKKKVSLDNIFQDFECLLCHELITVNVEEMFHGNPYCPKCIEDSMVTIGNPYMKIIPEFIINELRMLMQRITKYYQSDFIRDENKLREYSEPFIWGCRESGTDLVLMPKNPSEKPDESYIIWINGEDNKRSKEIRYFDGYSLEKITAEQAQRIWQDYCKGK
jgi:hypothetical protein